MKRPTIIRSLLLLCTVFTMGYSRAATTFAPEGIPGNSRIELERALEKQLNRHLTFPWLAQEDDMTGEVYVAFVINTEGKVQVLDCNSKNDALRSYVLRKLARIDIGENPDGVWKTTHLHLVFRPEGA